LAERSLPEALQSYRDMFAIRDRLAKSNPGNATWQYNLAVGYGRIGDVQLAQGNLPEALQSYNEAFAIRDRLAKSDPGDVGLQFDLAESYSELASAFEKAGDIERHS